MSEHEVRPRRKERPSFIWPLILIILGAVFLLSNLGVLDENIWDNIWRYWPVLLIAIGLDGLFRRNEIAGPVFMIGLGILFLLSSAGWIGWQSWNLLWRLWPILLVAVGIEIIIGRRSLWISLAAVVVIVATLGGLVWFLGGVSQIQGVALTEESVNQPLEGIIQAEIIINPALGELNIGKNQDPRVLIQGSLNFHKSLRVYSDYQVRGLTGTYKIESQSIGVIPSGQFWGWDLDLTDSIPLDVDLSMGVGEMNVDLSELVLTRLDVSQAVGKVAVALPEREDYKADLSQAVGSIEVVVPESAGVRIEISRAITSLSMPSTFERRGDYYYSPNYDQAETKIELQISQAIGSIEVQIEP